MNQEAKELQAFLNALIANPRDVETRKVLADWLDEHDAPEEADRQRNFSLEKYDAEVWLRTFCDRYSADYDDLLESVGAGKGYCFGDTGGPDAAEDPDFRRHVETLLGKAMTDQEWDAEPYHCSC